MKLDLKCDLKEREVHLYLVRPECAELTDESILNVEEHSRSNAFKFFRDRRLYVAAHIFLRQTLSRYGSLLPSAWRFSTNRYGKPAIANNGYESLRFNLSHTHGLIACAVSHKREVGIDVEKRKRLIDLESLCQYAFSASEASDVLSFDSIPAQEQRFFTYWTLKEAYIKAQGKGLSIPLQQFTFVEGRDKKWSLHCDSVLQDNGENWQFSTYLIDEHHLSLGVQVDSYISTPEGGKMPMISRVRICSKPLLDFWGNTIKFF